MALSNEYIEVRIDESFLSAIHNGDTSGLSEAGEGYFDAFIGDYGFDRGTFESDYELDSGHCEITGFWTEKLAVVKFWLEEDAV